jgi:hypothetical protein
MEMAQEKVERWACEDSFICKGEDGFIRARMAS